MTYHEMVLKDRKAEFQTKCIRTSCSRSLESDTCQIIKTDPEAISEFKNAIVILSFLKKVEDINIKFDDIQLFIKDVIKIQAAILEFSETDERLYSMYSRIKKELLQLGNKITALEKSFEIDEFHGSDTETRIYNTQMVNVRKRLSSCITYYYHIQEEYRNKCKAQVKRQAIIAGADVTKLNFDDVVGARTDVFLRTVLPDFDLAEHYYNEVKKRHDSFLKLEKSLEELRDLFFDFALITQVNYALINRIDKNTNEVERLLKDAKSAVISYRYHRKTSRLKLYMNLGCAALGIGFIFMILTAVIF